MISIFRTAAIGLLILVHGSALGVDIQQLETKSGLDVWLVEDNTVPMVAVEFSFLGGSAQDPADRDGVTKFLSYMLDEGGGDVDSESFQAKLEDLSIGLSFSARKEYFSGSLVTLTSTILDAFDLLELAVNQPRFDDQPMKRIRGQILQGLAASKNSPREIASREMAQAAFPDHVYSRDSDGLMETVTSISADDLEAMRKKIFAREHLKIAVVGAIDAATLLPLIDQVFGDLAAQSGIEPVATPDPIQPAELTISRDLAQTRISFLGPGYTIDHPDSLTAFVVNHIVGGGTFTSRLFDELREKRGLVYSANSGLSTTRTFGTVVGGLGTQRERSGEAVTVLKNVLSNFAATGPTTAELESAKKYLIGNFPLRFTTTQSIASQVLGLQVTGRSPAYWEDRTGLINAVSMADAQRVSAEIFDPKRMIFVILGD